MNLKTFRLGFVALVTFGLILAATTLVVGAAADSGDGPDVGAGRSLVEYTVANVEGINSLVVLGADLAEYVRKNDDGTLTVNAYVTPEDVDTYRAQGFEPGTVIETPETYGERMAERQAAMDAEQRAQRTAEGSSLSVFNARGHSSHLNSFDPGGEITVQRIDYFTNYAGRFLYVEARTSLGTNGGGPTMAVAWKPSDAGYGSATTLSKFTDASQYMYHQQLIRVGALGTTTPVPTMVRIASSSGAVIEAPVNNWINGGPPPLVPGYLRGFYTHYMSPTEVYSKINALHAEFPAQTDIIDLPIKTNGYQRKSMAVMQGTTGIGNAPSAANQAATVVLFAKAYGQDGGNSIQAEFLNPGAASQPLTVTVTGGVLTPRITVRLATSATSALTSTAAQVRNAINADPAASALVNAYTYANNAGTGIMQVRALVNLSDFLAAPTTGPSAVVRGPATIQALRIGTHRDGSKVGVFLFCEQHAREWVTPLVCVEAAEQLLRNYATNPQTKAFVDNLDIFIVPSANPDGSNYSFFDFASQRKNMTNYCPVTATTGMPSGRTAWGVDINRNSTIGTLFDGYDGASAACNNETYAGPSEGSEPEIKNEQWLVDTYSNIKFSINIHTYGGYFMWSPGAYKLSGRVTLPAPNIGVESYFFAGAKTILNRIKEIRNTVVLPERTGPIADVLYSAAGNSADDHWYRKGIIAYSFEAGSDRFTSTTSGTSQSAVGFMPNYASEGQFEGLEFAAGSYGLLETALDYAQDTTPPIANLIPEGGVSKLPIKATFSYAPEPSVIFYTTDGSTPTTSSTTWNQKGPRQPGQTFLFDQPKTTIKWLAQDMKGNQAAVRTATFFVDTTAPTTTAAVDPAAVNGWNTSPSNVTLTGDDGAVGSGVVSSEYQLDGGAWTAYSAPFAVSGDGSHTVQFRSTDNAGNVETAKSATFTIDATPPTPPGTNAPAFDYSGTSGDWYKDAVTVSFLVGTDPPLPNGDPASGVDASSIPADQSFSTDGAHSASGTEKDLAGNESAPGTRLVNVDASAPLITATATTVFGTFTSGSWTNQNVTVTFHCTDAESGVASLTLPQTVFTAGAAQSVSGTCTDNVGHSSSLVFGGINIDKTAPEAAVLFSVAGKDVIVVGSDGLSGISSTPFAPSSVSLVAFDTGEPKTSELRTYVVTDAAGNTVVVIVKVKKAAKSVNYKIVSLRYNGGALITVPQNETSVGWSLRTDGSLSTLGQNPNLNNGGGNAGQVDVEASYSATTNTSSVKRNEPKPETKVTLPGVVLLRIATHQSLVGYLTVEY